ncbi:MAG: hypothetical protein F6J93_24430 [Oscillatoria sp. SIO1A7]|nr:hypothetical protein [Oscillatoria sp. SIO1A7]
MAADEWQRMNGSGWVTDGGNGWVATDELADGLWVGSGWGSGWWQRMSCGWVADGVADGGSG